MDTCLLMRVIISSLYQARIFGPKIRTKKPPQQNRTGVRHALAALDNAPSNLWSNRRIYNRP